MESKKRIPCNQCEKSYMHRKDLLRHVRNKHSGIEKSRSKRRAADDHDGVTKKIKLRPPSPMVIPDDPDIKVFCAEEHRGYTQAKTGSQSMPVLQFPSEV